MATILLDAEKVDNDDDGGGGPAAAAPPNGLEINVEEVVVSAEAAAVVMEIVVVDMEYCLIWVDNYYFTTYALFNVDHNAIRRRSIVAGLNAFIVELKIGWSRDKAYAFIPIPISIG